MAVNILLKRSSTASKRPTAAQAPLGELILNYDAATGGVFYQDGGGNIVKLGPAQVGATAPNSTPAGSAGNSAGEFWYDTGNSELKIWDGTAWQTAGGAGGVTSVSGTAPITVNNANPAAPVIGVTAATTAAAGVVQLNDTTASTSTAQAATANAVKVTYDYAATMLPLAGGTMTGAIVFAAGQTFPIAGIQDATAAQKGVVQIGSNIDVAAGVISVATATGAVPGVVQIGTNIDVAAGVISVADATAIVPGVVTVGSNIQVAAGQISVLSSTTGQAGVVQLEDSVTSNSTTLALTANQGLILQGQIDSLSVNSGNLTMAGTLDASSGNMATVTTAGTAESFAVGSPLPTAAVSNDGYYAIVTTAGTFTPPGGASTSFIVGDWVLSNGTSYEKLPLGFTAPAASTTAAGVVELATDAETQAGTDATLAVTPAGLQSKLSDSTNTTSSTTIASSTAVKTTYDYAATMLPLAGGTMTGAITFAAGQTFPIAGIQDATAAQKGVVQIGANIDVAAGVISVADATLAVPGVVTVGTNIQVAAGVISVLSATTGQAGVVQLEDSVTSSSTTLALTANQGLILQGQIDNLSTNSGNLQLAGTINATTGNMTTVTTAGTAESFVVGSPMPAAAAGNDGYYALVTTAGTFTPPGGAATTFNVGDWVLSNGTAYERLPLGFTAPAASTTAAGIVELADNAETQAGTDATLAVTPAGLQSKLSDSVATTSSTTIASSTAVKTAYDLANAAIAKSLLTAAGGMIYATAAATPAELAVGTAGQVMVVNGTADAPEWSSTIDGGTY